MEEVIVLSSDSEQDSASNYSVEMEIEPSEIEHSSEIIVPKDNATMQNSEIVKKIKDGQYNVLKRTGRSVIWSCFSEIQKDDGSIFPNRLYCRVCHKIFKYFRKQTSNLIRHKCVYLQTHTGTPIQVNNDDKEVCFQTFLHFIIEDCRPFSVVEGTGFYKMIKKFTQIGARYGENVDLENVIPSARTLSRKCKLVAEEKKQEIKSYIQNLIINNEAAVTIDMWTDDFVKRNFLCATLHFQANYRIMDITLGIKSMDFMSSTADNITEKLNSLFEEFGVTDISNVVFVTDRGSNIVSALKDFTRLNCSAHLLSNVLSHAFESTNELKGITHTCKKVVKYFKKGNKQHMLHTTLESHCPTRWNSHLSMFKSIFDNYEKINEILRSNDEGLSMLNLNMFILQGLAELCNDFEKIFKTLQARMSPTICFVIPSINKIKMICNKQNNEEAAITVLKMNILSHLEKWISNLNILHKAALFLYPPAISLQSNEINEIKEFCIKRITELHTEVSSKFFNSSSNISSTSSSQDIQFSSQTLQSFPPALLVSSSPASISEPSTSNLNFLFPTLISKSKITLETERDEVERYCNEKIRLTEDFDVMLWWKNSSSKYPKLSRLATKILSIPASSASSESVFSLAGNIITEKRNRLEPKTIDSILFLNSLYKSGLLNTLEINIV